jgi:hypothetical protein
MEREKRGFGTDFHVTMTAMAFATTWFDGGGRVSQAGFPMAQQVFSVDESHERKDLVREEGIRLGRDVWFEKFFAAGLMVVRRARRLVYSLPLDFPRRADTRRFVGG